MCWISIISNVVVLSFVGDIIYEHIEFAMSHFVKEDVITLLYSMCKQI